MVKGLKVKKIIAIMIMGLLVFTNVSCAQQTENPAPVKAEQTVQDKPATENTAAQGEIIYLR